MDGRPDKHLDDQRVDSEEPEPIRCRACGNELADPSAICAIGGKPVQIQVNPHGVAFEVLSLSNAHGMVFRGGPVRADTWYPGYAWTIAWCAACQEHLGWRFDAIADVSPTRFYGLVVGRLTGV